MRQKEHFVALPVTTALISAVLAYLLAGAILLCGSARRAEAAGAGQSAASALPASREPSGTAQAIPGTGKSAASGASGAASGSAGASAVSAQQKMSLKLMDISHYDTVTDWAAAKKAVDGVYIKATEGTSVTDPKLRENAQGAGKARIPAGYYHYFWPTDAAGAAQQARFFYAAIKGYPNALRPALDLEEANGRSAADVAADVLAFEQEFEKLSGTDAMLYSSPNFANTYLADSRLSRYPFWIASYGEALRETPTVWTAFDAWQYGAESAVSGVANPVDVDVAVPSVLLDSGAARGLSPGGASQR